MPRKNSRSSSSTGNNNTRNPTRVTRSTTSSQSTVPLVPNNAVTPLLSLQFPTTYQGGLGPRTHSSPETYSTVPRPAYSELTNRQSSEQRSGTTSMPQNNLNPVLPRIDEILNPNMSNHSNPANMSQLNPNNNSVPQNEEIAQANGGLTNEDIRRYVSASMQVVHTSIMREVQNMQLMLPQLIRESLHSERNDSRDIPNHSGNVTLNSNYQMPQYQQQAFPTNQPQATQPQYQQHSVPQQLFANTPQDFSQHRPCFNAQQSYSGFGQINPNHLEKWGLKYDGTNKQITVEDFVFRVESLRSDYNCSWDVVMKGFHHLLTGAANSWFWSFRMKYPTSDWFTFKINLIKKFRNFESDFEVQRRIMERRQAPHETADNFISEIVRLKNQMRNHVAESELVKIVKDNLKDGLAQMIFPIRIDTLDQLLDECKRAERNISKRSAHRAPAGNMRRVYEVDVPNFDEEDGQTQIVEALQKDKAPAKQFVCWNCKTPGHSFIECPVEQRRLFCYKCGYDDVTSPNCPRCLGNLPPNARKTGPACSTQNESQ